METLSVRTKSRIEFVDITSQVRNIIGKSGIDEGIAVVFAAHTTAGITINESADPAVVTDIIEKLSQLAPYNDSYRHMEGNSDAHIKSSLMGSSVNIVISRGSPALGTWQGIFFCEFDGPRTRKVYVQLTPA